jgi:2-polyprenyl-3-methyl-5-hydroxy-6-metoxy-1,4-benzoquinol methylase
LEFTRTKEVVLRYLSLPATVLDVGGASGAYALWLAERGYQVHLIDPSIVGLSAHLLAVGTKE